MRSLQRMIDVPIIHRGCETTMTPKNISPGGDRLDSRIKELISMLSDPEKGVREEAMRGFVAIGRPAVPACISLLESTDWRVRYRAAETLGLIGGHEAYDPLLSALQDSKDHVRYMAAKGLGLIGDSRAVASLAALQHDENEFVRRSAARSLGQIGGREAIRALRQALDTEREEGVRAAIVEALRDAGHQAGVSRR